MKRTKNQKIPLNTSKLYIGIDNGVSGTIGWSGICKNGHHLFGQQKVPTFSQQNYTKAKGNITRIDHNQLQFLLSNLIKLQGRESVMALVERPMINATRFKASMSASRALESTLIILEKLEIPYQYVDSKEWQKAMLPKGIKGGPELKKAGKEIAARLFPTLECKPDADGLLIAEWARRIWL